MKITAKYNSKCPSCGGYINAGETVEWESGKKATHVVCPAKAAPAQPEPLLAGGPPKRTEKRNKKAASCDRCGTYLAAGEGLLYFCVEDSGCLEHHDRSGWHVYCPDTAVCDQHRAAAKAARAKRAEEAKAAAAEAKKVEDALRAQLAELKAGFEAKGWVRMFGTPGPLKKGQELVRITDARGYGTVLSAATLEDGTEIAHESLTSYDDWRDYTWGPKALIQATLRAQAAKAGITRQAAEEWLAKYSGCEGAELYRAVLEGEG